MKFCFIFALVLLVVSRAQLFTCNDTVTLCQIGTETCCCEIPIVVACECCQTSEICVAGVCAVPSMTTSPSTTQTPSPSTSPSITSTPSPSATTGQCSTTDSTLSCQGPLDNVEILLAPQVSAVEGDLILTNTTVLELESPLQVQGAVVVDGLIRYSVVEVPADGFVPILSSNSSQLVFGDNLTVELVDVPEPDEPCEQVRQDQQTRDNGRSFGVLLTVDTSACSNGDDSSNQSLIQIIVPVIVCVCVIFACAMVITGLVATLVCWRRLAPMMWKREDAETEAIVSN